MFRTLSMDRTTRFDHLVRAAVVAMSVAFAFAVVAGISDLGPPVDQVADTATVSAQIVSIEALLPDIGGALLNLPVFRL